MARDFASEETTVVATYSSRHDAEVASALLEDHGLDSFVLADDVHPPMQLTEGARLVVMAAEADRARRILENLPDTSSTTGAQPGHEHESTHVRMTAWMYIALFVLIIAAVLGGLVIL